MKCVRMRDRKLLVLFDFYMEIKFGIHRHDTLGCPFAEGEFEWDYCEGLCHELFDSDRSDRRCPCSEWGEIDSVKKLHDILVLGGFIPHE